jgi:hypothetical protein
MATTLDDWLPSFSVRERHQRVIDAEPEATLAAALALPVAPDRMVRALFRLRGLGAGRQTIAEFASSNGFLVLERTPTTFVFGLAGRLRGPPRFAASREQWLAFTPPGLKIVGDFRVEPAAEGRTLLSTETRVSPLDRGSAVLFRLYWLLIGPFSALIRRRWLRAIARTAAATD